MSDQGDSFLGMVEQMMGAPALPQKGSSQGGSGDSFIHGIFQAIGIGNKDIAPMAPAAASAPTAQEMDSVSAHPAAEAAAQDTSIGAPSGTAPAADSGGKSGSGGIDLGAIMKLVGTMFGG